MDKKGFHFKTNKLKRVSSTPHYLILISKHFFTNLLPMKSQSISLPFNNFECSKNFSRIIDKKYILFYYWLPIVGMSVATVSCMIDFFSCLETQYPVSKLVTNSSSLSKVRYNLSIRLSESYQH